MRICLILVLLAGSYATLISTQRESASSDSHTQVRTGHELFTRVWTVKDGLGPLINARSCVGCHAAPRTGGSGTDERSLVSIVSTPLEASGGRVFQRLRVSKTGAIDEHATPVGVTLRRAPSLLGSALLESVSDDEIAAGAAEAGTRGRIPQGRYGWKGRIGNIEEATVAAFANELGISGAELPQSQLTAVIAFIRSLPPVKGDRVIGDQHGQELFDRLGCAACHRPSFPSLEKRRLFPYTDLLLHDMGPALADGINEGTATGSEFKTPALWGVSKTGPPYLHDGRAKTLHNSIATHGGEAEESANLYRNLSDVERAAVLAFLRSL